MIVVDVGANKGELSKFLLEKTQGIFVYAIEPNYMLCSESLTKIHIQNPQNFTYLPIAISRTKGRAKLFAPEVLGGQVGSLLQINTSGAWHPSVSTSLLTATNNSFLEVDTCTVAEITETLNIHFIDFLKIDTQGTDLDILEDFLSKCDVKVAAVEVEINPDQSLSHYQHSNNDIWRLFGILQFFGFRIMRMMPVSADCREFNIFIAKSNSDFDHVDQWLNFRSMPVFSRYWEVLGIGDKSQDLGHLQRSIFKKVRSALRHPRQSFKSVIIKLSA